MVSDVYKSYSMRASTSLVTVMKRKTHPFLLTLLFVMCEKNVSWFKKQKVFNDLKDAGESAHFLWTDNNNPGPVPNQSCQKREKNFRVKCLGNWKCRLTPPPPITREIITWPIILSFSIINLQLPPRFKSEMFFLFRFVTQMTLSTEKN